MKYCLLMLVCLVVSDSYAGADASTQTTWDRTKEATSSVITFSKKAGDKVVLASKQAYASLAEGSPRTTPEERFVEIWNTAIEQMINGFEILQRTKDAPDSAIFRKDKLSFRVDFNQILDELIVLLDDPYIQDDREEISYLRKLIVKKRDAIIRYRERKISAPMEHMVKTTKGGYDKKIQGAKQDIADYRDQIENIYLLLQERLRGVGLNLDHNQTIALLSRVDSEDIIQMSVVFDEVKMFTEQIKILTKSSGEEIHTAKRYYGMHIILIEMVVYMQSKYIKQIDKEFVPKLRKIIAEVKSLARKTKHKILKEKDNKNKRIYQKNLESQNLSIQVANMYMQFLGSQRLKVFNARKKAINDLELAKNTYDTVEVSAELLNLLDYSQNVFAIITELQLPDIVPFENFEMEVEFQKLSKQIQEAE